MEFERTQLNDSFVHMISLKSQSSIEDVEKWLNTNAGELLGDNNLGKHGALLFRGFPVHNSNDFHRFLLALNVVKEKFEMRNLILKLKHLNFKNFGSFLGGGGPRNVIQGLIIYFII